MLYEDHTKFREYPSFETLKTETTRIKRFCKHIFPHKVPSIQVRQIKRTFKRVAYLTTLAGRCADKRYICYGYVKEHNLGSEGSRTDPLFLQTATRMKT